MAIVAPPPKTLIVGVVAIVSMIILFRLLSVNSYSSYVPSFRGHQESTEVVNTIAPPKSEKTEKAAKEKKPPKHETPKVETFVESPVRNHTLGFEKIFALNLADRSDKRDGLSLAASLSNLTIDYVDGVKGEDVPEKAFPYGEAAPKFTKPMLGSWRAHMNAIRSVLEQGLSSALIIEDDVDWDVRVKDQLVQYAEASRLSQGFDTNTETHSPYGDDWDVLWLGHCQGRLDDSREPISFEDITAVSPHRLQIGPKMKEWLSQWPDHTRVVRDGKGFICTYAYAVSRRGAEKLLWDLSVKHLTALFDNAVDLFCKHFEGSVCMGAYPSYFWPHEARGGVGKNSDNRPDLNGITESITKNIQWPVRMNIEKMLKGQTDFEDVWPDDATEKQKQEATFESKQVQSTTDIKKADQMGDVKRRSPKERRTNQQ